MAPLRPFAGRSRALRWALGLTGLLGLGAATLSQGPLLETGPEARAQHANGPEAAVSRSPSAGVADRARAPQDGSSRSPTGDTSQGGPQWPGPGLEPMALWELSGGSVHAFDHPIGQHRPERHALRFDPRRTRELSVGDRIALPLPGLGTLVATIERAWHTPLGNRGLTGSIEGLDPAYAVTLTQGHTTLFGRITTPYGNYLLEGTGGAAAIHLDDLDRLIDPDRTDERIPPEAGEEPV